MLHPEIWVLCCCHLLLSWCNPAGNPRFSPHSLCCFGPWKFWGGSAEPFEQQDLRVMPTGKHFDSRIPWFPANYQCFEGWPGCPSTRKLQSLCWASWPTQNFGELCRKVDRNRDLEGSCHRIDRVSQQAVQPRWGDVGGRQDTTCPIGHRS